MFFPRERKTKTKIRVRGVRGRVGIDKLDNDMKYIDHGVTS